MILGIVWQHHGETVSRISDPDSDVSDAAISVGPLDAHLGGGAALQGSKG